ncbi:MAG: hypothetical protein NVS3B15_13810 [Sediminibacterium sp.]
MSRSLFLMAFVTMLVAGCGKLPVTISPEEQAIKYLSGEAGNGVWRISKVYENGIEVPLTGDQMKYTKTYTIGNTPPFRSGRFDDSDRNQGTWVLVSTLLLNETITNNPGGNISLQLILNVLTDHAMDVQYPPTVKTIRTVYYAC